VFLFLGDVDCFVCDDIHCRAVAGRSGGLGGVLYDSAHGYEFAKVRSFLNLLCNTTIKMTSEKYHQWSRIGLYGSRRCRISPCQLANMPTCRVMIGPHSRYGLQGVLQNVLQCVLQMSHLPMSAAS